MADTIDWTGQSGKTYRYWIYEYPTNLTAKAGNYIFAKETSPGKWSPVYIGQTTNVDERFNNHHKIQCIRRNGATHIHAHLNSDKQDRFDEEADLIAKWDTPCND